MPIPAIAALRQGLLAVCVLHDVDLVPMPGGIVLIGDIRITWDECAQALAGSDPDSAEGRDRLATWLRACCAVAWSASGSRADRIRPLGLPVGHACHPGPGWGRPVLGGVLELGLGIIGADPARPDDVTPVPPGVWGVLALAPADFRPGAEAYLTKMSRLAAERRLARPAEPLRPMGDCDVVTLLCHRDFRIALTDPHGDMAAAGVPMRSRGWTEIRRIDPAFIVAAAAATDPVQRGFLRPLLITADEVVMVPEGGRPAAISLLDRAPEEPWLRPVRYR